MLLYYKLKSLVVLQVQYRSVNCTYRPGRTNFDMYENSLLEIGVDSDPILLKSIIWRPSDYKVTIDLPVLDLHS